MYKIQESFRLPRQHPLWRLAIHGADQRSHWSSAIRRRNQKTCPGNIGSDVMISIVFHPRGVHNQRLRKMTKSSNHIKPCSTILQNRAKHWKHVSGRLWESALFLPRCLWYGTLSGFNAGDGSVSPCSAQASPTFTVHTLAFNTVTFWSAQRNHIDSCWEMGQRVPTPYGKKDWSLYIVMMHKVFH